MAEDDLPLAVGPYNKPVGSRDWVDNNQKEQHVALRLQNAPGQEVAWVLYPRGAGEAAPLATQLAPGVTKVVTAEGTDYVFLSTTPLTFTGEGVEFSGLAGAVRVPKKGKATLVLAAGPGKVGYQRHVIESTVPFEKTVSAGKKTEILPDPVWNLLPSHRRSEVDIPHMGNPWILAAGVTKTALDGLTQYTVNAQSSSATADGEVKLYARKATVEIRKDNIRFLVPEQAYAQLSVGNVGVRGVGPFDLTFTADGITGTVDGDIRTLVTTWPEQITRPGYSMDGVRWYAGFADEHSIYQGTRRRNSPSPWASPPARTR